MSNDILYSKIDLLQEQIDNLEKSGYFTEEETLAASQLRMELVSLKALKATRLAIVAMQNFSIALEHSSKECKAFKEATLENKNAETLWDVLDAFVNPVCDIEVIDAEVLTPNSIKA